MHDHVWFPSFSSGPFSCATLELMLDDALYLFCFCRTGALGVLREEGRIASLRRAPSEARASDRIVAALLLLLLNCCFGGEAACAGG